MARRGARSLGLPDQASASEAWRETVARAAGRDPRGNRWEPDEVWLLDDPEPEPSEAPASSVPAGPRRRASSSPRDLAVSGTGTPTPGGRRRNVPRQVVDDLASAAGAARGEKLAARIADATYAYDRERYQDARRILRPLVVEIPGSAAVQELYGLVLYRSAQWAQAARHLEIYRGLTGSCDQHPVLADCYRALHRYREVEALWDELRKASPSGDLVAEGRIVAAGCRADKGDLAGAIAILERSARRVDRPQDRHVRQWYALGDLYERAGDHPRARDLFARVASVDPDAFDVRQRLRALR